MKKSVKKTIPQICHAILEALFESKSFHISGYHSSHGTKLINKVILETCKLQFGNIAFLLNSPEKYRMLPHEEFQEPIILVDSIEDVEVSPDAPFPIDSISLALEVLLNKEYVTEIVESHSRLIKLTIKGAVACINEEYLQVDKRNSYEDRLFQSSILTNKLMVTLTVALVVAAMLQFFQPKLINSNDKPVGNAAVSKTIRT